MIAAYPEYKLNVPRTNFFPQPKQHYLGTSQLASNNYLPISTSIHSPPYGIRTGLGASRVCVAPPSYSAFDVSSLPAVNTGNWHTQYSRRTEADKSFQDYGNEERNIWLSTLK
ncbi:hypothetical protein POM88_033119 [Heracleum sosnowskyi]|uniref:Uncharacterized protein n=1 Tax=Heracleum sosnowskyi TaxID=360622 RepID=A0AAD8I0Z1_9APIA|nr:hypothetical protein POM88_033119 [Heracleum sosnowskyi]